MRTGERSRERGYRSRRRGDIGVAVRRSLFANSSASSRRPALRTARGDSDALFGAWRGVTAVAEHCQGAGCDPEARRINGSNLPRIQMSI